MFLEIGQFVVWGFLTFVNSEIEVLMVVGKWKLWFAIAPLLLLAFGCSDDSVTPNEEIGLAELAGEWEAKSIFIDSDERPLSSGNVYWYFSGTGEFCTMWATAYGTYYSGQYGQVSMSGLVLSDDYLDEQARWQLALSANLDTLRAFLIEPDSILVDSWLLERTTNAPEPTCFSEE